MFTMMLTSGSLSGWESIIVLIMAPLHYSQVCLTRHHSYIHTSYLRACERNAYVDFVDCHNNKSIHTIIYSALTKYKAQAQWAGYVSSLVALFGGDVVGKIHDKFHNGKFLLVVLYALSVASFLFFTLATSDFVLRFFHTPFWVIIFVITVGTTALYAAYPLGYLFYYLLFYFIISFCIFLLCLIILFFNSFLNV